MDTNTAALTRTARKRALAGNAMTIRAAKAQDVEYAEGSLLGAYLARTGKAL